MTCAASKTPSSSRATASRVDIASPTRMPSGRAPGTAITATMMSRSVMMPFGLSPVPVFSTTTKAPT